ncbi:MAG TPA: hypothetical protein PKA64_09375, partial [Myxococcota bacterium]|nr:hypothetical protein [Myxococcota bacterium]
MSLVFSMAWRNLLRHRGRTALTALMMGMAVAMSMVILCLSEGSRAQMREVLVTGTLGHVQVVDPEWPGRRPMDQAMPGADALVVQGPGGDRWVVNGQKVWISRIQHSDLMILLARTTPL